MYNAEGKKIRNKRTIKIAIAIIAIVALLLLLRSCQGVSASEDVVVFESVTTEETTTATEETEVTEETESNEAEENGPKYHVPVKKNPNKKPNIPSGNVIGGGNVHNPIIPDYTPVVPENPPVHEETHTHKYEVTKFVQATCSKDGYTLYACSCGDSYKEAVVSGGHTYAETVIAPTENAGGYTQYFCTKCGDYYEDNFTDPIAPTQPEETTPPTTEPEATEPPVTEPAPTQPEETIPPTTEPAPTEPVQKPSFDCGCPNDGHNHIEIQKGSALWIYCEYATSVTISPDGLVCVSPWDFYA